MSHRLSATESRSFTPDANRPSSSSYTPLGLDDPAIIEESKLLLSQFIQYSARGNRSFNGKQTRNTSDASYGRLGLRNESSPSRSRNDSATPVHGWQSPYVIPDDSISESSSPHYDDTRQQPVLNSQSKIARIFPGTFLENARASEPPLIDLEAAKEYHKVPVMKKRRRRTLHAPRSPGKKESPSSDVAQPARRSRRSRTGPTNYYQKMRLSESETEEHPSSNHSSRSSSRLRQHGDLGQILGPMPQPSKHHPDSNTTYSLVCRSRKAQILRSPVRDDGYDVGQEHLPYSPESNPARYLNKIASKPVQTNSVLHVDFSKSEMTALLEMLSLYGYRRPSPHDMTLPDQLIQALSNPALTPKFPRMVSRICRLSQVITDEEVADPHTWLTALISAMDKKKHRQARHLVTKVLGIDSTGGNLLSPDGRMQPQLLEKVNKLSGCLEHASVLRKRESTAIDSFLLDARKGFIPSVPHVFRVTLPADEHSPEYTKSIRARDALNNLLHRRELGEDTLRGIQSYTRKDFGPTKTWKGASNDVIVLAWSPDGTRFAAGATAQCDEHNMEYNRGNNLVLGDLSTNTLEELPDHHIPRPHGRAASSRTVNDARLFMSVSSMEWHHDALFTASYDNTVKLWDFPNHHARCFKTLRHDSKVEVMARSKFESNILATGTKSIGLWQIQESYYFPLELPKHRSKREIDLVPTSLAWGTIPATKNILLAGMSEKDEGVSKNGLLAGWQLAETAAYPITLLPNAQNIFDIKWHPTRPLVATASSVSLGASMASKGTRSVVRFYEPLTLKTRTVEFECPALDINDVTICPSNSIYVTASCTNGITYVWDSRYPDTILHQLPHGPPLNQIDETVSREQADVGVRMAVWGRGADQFYTGASDGVLKWWDIFRSPEDVHVQDVRHFDEEIMSGAFSDDKSNLLIGDAAGGVHILSSGPYSRDGDRFDFRPAPLPADQHELDTDSGVATSRELLLSRELERDPIFGVGKGPRYNGPFAAWARPDSTPAEHLATTKLLDRVEIRQLDGLPPRHRQGLDEQGIKEVEDHIRLARIRNWRSNEHKRKRERSTESLPRSPNRNEVPDSVWAWDAKSQCQEPIAAVANTARPEVIDLTGELTETEGEGESHADSGSSIHFAGFAGLLEHLEDDFWWPASGEIDANIQEEEV